MGIKRCPKCGSTKLLAKKIVGTQVESTENGEFNVVSEGRNFHLEIVGCSHCKNNFTEADLVESVQCKKCGKYVLPQDLDANGECDICGALSTRPELAEMSKEDILRMMLRLERATQNNTEAPVQTNTPVVSTPSVEVNETNSVAEEKMRLAKEAINNASNDFAKQLTEEAKAELQEETATETTEVAEEGTKRRGRPRKKTTEDSVDTDAEVTPEQTEESVNAVSDSQEAPFPEKDPELNTAFSMPEPVMDTQSQPAMQFTMFDQEQSF